VQPDFRIHPGDWATDCTLIDRRSMKMPLVSVVIVLVIVGVVLYLINSYIPMASSIKSILNIVVVVAVCIWLLKVAGLWTSITNFQIG
jgi:predicted membrane protein